MSPDDRGEDVSVQGASVAPQVEIAMDVLVSSRGGDPARRAGAVYILQDK